MNDSVLRLLKKIVYTISLTLIAHTQIFSQVIDSTLLLPDKDMQWWKDAKFGLFIHYGVYAVHGRGEWAMFSEYMNISEYEKLKDKFNYNQDTPKRWVEIAQKAGCEYMVVTTRHHDGFSLFDTKFGDYDAVNSAAGRDIIKDYADAAHRAGMKMGFYYSPLDWRYPGFFFPDMYRASAEEMKKQTYTQVKELLTNYGKVDILWYDGGEDSWLGLGGIVWEGGQWKSRRPDKPYTGSFSWEPVKLNTMVRELQPQVVISERSGWMGDFVTRENSFGKKPNRPWEFCTNLGGSAWGWTPQAKHQVLSADSATQLLVKVVCMGGNLLLNVGPMANGEIEEIQAQRLEEIGIFLKKNGESIYGTKGGVYDDTWGGTTLTEKAIYVHILKAPADGKISIPATNRKIASAVILNTKEKIKFKQTDSGIELLALPATKKVADTIIKLSLK